MYKNYFYSNIAILVGILLIITIPINFDDPFASETFDLFTDFWLMLTFFFWYLWIRRGTLLITVAFSVISFNLKLLSSPILLINNASIIPDYTEGAALIFLCIGFVFMPFGLIEKSKNKLIMMESKWGIKHVSLSIICFTLMTQLVFRIL